MSNCSVVLAFASDVPLRFIHLFQIASSFTGIVAITVALKRRWYKPSVLSEGMGQFLLYCDIALLTAHNLTVIVVQGLHQYLFLTSTDLCYAMLVSWKCLSIRVPMFFTVCGLSFSQLLMTLDRALLSFGQGMEEKSLRKLKLISLVFLCVSSALLCYYAQHNVDMLQRMAYCSNTSDKSKEEMANIYNLLCVMDFTSTVALLLLLRKNSRDLARNVHAFHLDAKFRMRNNLASTRFLFALVGIRFLVLGTTVFSGLIIRHTLDFHDKYFRTLLEGLYLHQWFATILAGLLCAQDRFAVHIAPVIPAGEETSTHFLQLDRQWRNR